MSRNEIDKISAAVWESDVAKPLQIKSRSSRGPQRQGWYHLEQVAFGEVKLHTYKIDDRSKYDVEEISETVRTWTEHKQEGEAKEAAGQSGKGISSSSTTLTKCHTMQ
ncbi:hypothetical protein PQX77_000205 [Marasmius sp. AFHP31]|nr:hypothetical protein PQX77_000205 [Marasmius sp. AFHP31]